MSTTEQDQALTEILKIQALPSMSQDLKTMLHTKFSTPWLPSETSPQLIVIGGGPGAGKSFFYEHLKKNLLLLDAHFLHDPDLLLPAIPDYQDAYRIDPVQAYRCWELPVRQMSHELLLESLTRCQSVAYVRTLAHAESLALIQYCKEVLGYEITIHLLTCTIDVALQRALSRQSTILRHLDPELIVQRHHTVAAYIPQLRDLADHYFQYDNSFNERMPTRCET